MWTIKDEMYFANGVAVSPDQTYLLVNETGAYKITKIWIAGEKKANLKYSWKTCRWFLMGSPTMVMAYFGWPFHPEGQISWIIWDLNLFYVKLLCAYPNFSNRHPNDMDLSLV